MRFPLLAAVAAVVAAPALAQDAVVLRPGHPDLTTAGLTFESHIEAVRIAEPNVQDLGLVTHEVTRDGDTVTMVVDANVPQAGDVGETTVVFDAATLAPASHRRTSGRSAGSTTFDGAHVTGEYGRGEWDPLPFDITLDGPAFAPEQVPLVARALPLRDGYTATVPTFSADRRVRDVALAVVGQEEFTRADGSAVTAWAVEAVTPGRGGGTRRYFVADGTRELVAMSFSPQEGTVVVTEPTTEEALAALAEADANAVALRPGSDALDVSLLADEARTYTIKVVQPIQQDAGTLSRTVAIDREAGTVTIETTQEIAMAGSSVAQTSVASYPGLVPISSTSVINGKTTEVTYGDGTATRTTDDGETTELPFDEPVFAPSFLFEVVRLLPYEEGYRASFHTLEVGEAGAPVIGVTVAAPTEIDGRTVWPVITEGGPGQSFTFYVDPETRELVRIDQSPQAGVMVHVVPDEM